jgi:hypothetical protein
MNDGSPYVRAVVVGLQVDHGLTQLEAYRALRGPAALYIMGAGLPSADAVDLIARICDARHRAPPHRAYTDPIVNV